MLLSSLFSFINSKSLVSVLLPCATEGYVFTMSVLQITMGRGAGGGKVFCGIFRTLVAVADGFSCYLPIGTSPYTACTNPLTRPEKGGGGGSGGVPQPAPHQGEAYMIMSLRMGYLLPSLHPLF